MYEDFKSLKRSSKKILLLICLLHDRVYKFPSIPVSLNFIPMLCTLQLQIFVRYVTCSSCCSSRCSLRAAVGGFYLQCCCCYFTIFYVLKKWKQSATPDLYQNHFDTVFEGSRTPSTHFTTVFSPFSLGDPVKENEAKVNCALPPANFEDIKELHKRISYKVQTKCISWLRRLSGYESLV